ncbi:glycosyltransferase [Collinsella ihumii]|uniref:Glycosyltransferase n=1 Tax=Collinsella ihumii TaxID=1720204 RepID=A0AAW7K3L5_9ACTN|nr:glycosyltransferase [Collinsella ihumii]MDN0069456.1 glycosyltransferase [Collinsella ihumii]
MRYVQINAYANGWADSVIFSKHRELQAQGHESWVFWARGEHEQDEHMQKIASHPEVCLDALLTRIDGRAGFHSKGVTRRLLRKLDEIDPDVVHLHLLLGYYINVKMLFEWLAAHRCQVIWTLHDCWAFTGHCIHFTYAQCDQWKNGCASSSPCPQKRTYPETYFGGNQSVSWSFGEKKKLFTMLPAERMRLITPSRWLANLVKQSFLSEYEVQVIHNTVDTSVFKPTPSDFRERYGIGDRFMVLGVASKWDERKGLDVFAGLAKDLDSRRFAIVVVGLSKEQIKQVQGVLVALPHTDSQLELAEAYTAADVLLNPSAEETFGMNVAEAAACGTRSIVMEGSACAEVAKDAIVISADMSILVEAVASLEQFGHANVTHP